MSESRLHVVRPDIRAISPEEARRVTREAFLAVNRRRLPVLALLAGLGMSGLAARRMSRRMSRRGSRRGSRR
jgi:hypothetical protein